jgi:hypothetical protein
MRTESDLSCAGSAQSCTESDRSYADQNCARSFNNSRPTFQQAVHMLKLLDSSREIVPTVQLKKLVASCTPSQKICRARRALGRGCRAPSRVGRTLGQDNARSFGGSRPHFYRLYNVKTGWLEPRGVLPTVRLKKFVTSCTPNQNRSAASQNCRAAIQNCRKASRNCRAPNNHASASPSQHGRGPPQQGFCQLIVVAQIRHNAVLPESLSAHEDLRQCPDPELLRELAL